jgi:hypothetical protein
MPLVTSADLAAYMHGLTWTPVQQAQIDGVVLPGVQQQLEQYLGRPVEPMHVREARPFTDGRIWLTVSPVWQILSYDWQGQGTFQPTTYVPAPLPPSNMARTWDDASTGMNGSPNGTFVDLGVMPPGYFFMASDIMSYVPVSVIVEYIGGYNGFADQALKLAIERVAAREVERLYDNTIGLRDGSGQPAGDSDPRPKGWQPDELAAFDRIRRRVVAT